MENFVNFYPTPKSLIKTMLRHVDLWKMDGILENSKLHISGVGIWYRIWLRVLTKKANKHLLEDASVVFSCKIRARQYSSLWYGGEVASISYRRYKFLLSATGDVYAGLINKMDGNCSLFYLKDKNNGGFLADELIPYIKTDTELYAAIRGTHKRYLLELEHNNWWECFLIDLEGNYFDLMMALNSDGVFDAIAEILIKMDEIIEHSKNQNGGTV